MTFEKTHQWIFMQTSHPNNIHLYPQSSAATKALWGRQLLLLREKSKRPRALIFPKGSRGVEITDSSPGPDSEAGRAPQSLRSAFTFEEIKRHSVLHSPSQRETEFQLLPRNVLIKVNTKPMPTKAARSMWSHPAPLLSLANLQNFKYNLSESHE